MNIFQFDLRITFTVKYIAFWMYYIVHMFFKKFMCRSEECDFTLDTSEFVYIEVRFLGSQCIFEINILIIEKLLLKVSISLEK